MIVNRRLFLAGICTLGECYGPGTSQRAPAGNGNTVLWFRQPASGFRDGLPIGTGRMAAMIFGDPVHERIALNHEWLWTGRTGDHPERNPLRETTPVPPEKLRQVRDLLLSGKYEEGTRLGNDYFVCNAPKKNRLDSYQPVGDLHFTLDHGPAGSYRRELDLSNGLATVEYDADGRHFVREYLAHWALDLLFVRVRATEGPISGAFWLGRIDDPMCKPRFRVNGSTVTMDGAFPERLRFRAVMSAFAQGNRASLVADGQKRFRFSQANELVVVVNMGTSANGNDPEKEAAIPDLAHSDWNRLLSVHRSRYAEVYGKSRLRLNVPLSELPTDERRRRAEANPASEPGLAELFFNYGRYLLCASSVRAQLPPNLQGKWNEELTPPWESDYHHDINLQFSYWPAEVTGLQDLTEPLFRHIENMLPEARKAARNLYGCAGVWLPLQTDPWGRVAPQSYGWSVWVGAAAWLAQHVWWHYEFGKDRAFLRRRAYPYFKEVAAFYESYLIKDEKGVYQIVPSQSPENHFIGGGTPVSLCVSSAMDVQLARELLQNTIRASEILGVDREKRAVWREILAHLPPDRIGSFGQFLEWNQEFEEAEPGHRHLSPLYGAFPGDLFTIEDTPKLMAAVRVLLERRIASGSNKSRLNRLWAPAIFARLGDAERAYEQLMNAIVNLAPKDNLFHTDIMHAAAADVAEMLLQSSRSVIRLLPALPSYWPSGEARGLRARGGFTVDISWQNRRLIQADIVGVTSGECVVKKISGTPLEVVDENGASIVRKDHDGNLAFPTKAGRRVTVRARS